MLPTDIPKHILPPGLTVSGSTVYASQGSIYAMEASSGALRRNYQIQGVANSRPTVVGDVIYINLNYMDDHTIQALRAADGAPVWRYEVTAYLPSSPIVADEVIYASAGDTIHALQARDGAPLWHYTTSGLLFASPTVVGGVVYMAPIVNSPEKPAVFALDAGSGALLWRVEVPDSSSMPLTVVDGVVYMSANNGCSTLRARDGAPIWQLRLPASDRPEPIVADDSTHIFHWTHVLVRSAPVVVGGAVYISLCESRSSTSLSGSGEPTHTHTSEEVVSALQATDGSPLWRHQLAPGEKPMSPSSPVVAEGVVYVGADDGCLYALRAPDGDLLWRYQTGGALLSAPVVANGVVYVGANDGYVYALQVGDGSLLWRSFASVAVSAVVGIQFGRFRIKSTRVQRADE
jgi:outer membrane protein assembly factor BamB